jgi:hypothetical protein
VDIEDIKHVRDKYVGKRIGGHYPDCWREHIDCCVARLVEEVELLREMPSLASTYDYRSYAPLLWKAEKHKDT